jgi:hypothetical protein
MKFKVTKVYTNSIEIEADTKEDAIRIAQMLKHQGVWGGSDSDKFEGYAVEKIKPLIVGHLVTKLEDGEADK